MTIILALDIGKRRTGIAFGDDNIGFVAAMDTIRHASIEALVDRVRDIAQVKKVGQLIIGLPLLPGGKEGEQARYVREVAKRLEKDVGLPVECVDERYTTSKGHPEADLDAKAACELLTIVIDRMRKK